MIINDIHIQAIYEPLHPNASKDTLVQLMLRQSSLVIRDLNILVPASQLRLSDLERKYGPLVNPDKDSRQKFEENLVASYVDAIRDPARHGYLLDHIGRVVLPSDDVYFLRGEQLIGGSPDIPYILTPELRNIHLASSNGSPAVLGDILLGIQYPGLMAFAYTMLSSVRSLILGDDIELQAVMWLVGPHGLGKTTTTERICLPYHYADGQPYGLLQAASTPAAVEKAAVSCYDAVLVIDDLAKSASPAVERERKTLCAKAVRIGTGMVPITKCNKNGLDNRFCNAGILMTAEFGLDNASDIERLIIVPITEQMALPHTLTPGLIGDAIRHFSLWMTEHHKDFLDRLHERVGATRHGYHSVRVETNYACLREVMREFLRSMEHLGVSADTGEQIMVRLEAAIQESLAAQDAAMAKLEEDKAAGNLAYIILAGLGNDAFRTTKNVDKFSDLKSKKDAVFVKGDLCMIPESLIHFVCAQPGYHDWTRQKVVNELKSYGALRIQRNGNSNSNTIKLKHGAPPTYRIVLDALEEAAEKYE